MGTMNPRGSLRLIYHADGHPTRQHIPVDPKPADLHQFVDHLADAGVDVFSSMCFVSGQANWQTDLAMPMYSKWDPSDPGRLRLERLWAQGAEPIDVCAKRCHERGMKFLAKFRMNDRHSQGKLSGHYNIHMGTFIQEHQEWWLKDFPGGLDFTHQGVRDWMFELAREVTTTFDIDGLTFNYMRYPYVFEIAESRSKQPILTGFMRRVRRMLDEEGKKKGRELLFCVLVAPTIEECHNIGLDVPSWIREGIVDVVCPCDWGSTLFNVPYEEFAKLTRQTDVLLLPAVHANVSRSLYFRKLMSPASYRGVARNLYAAGADGISTFNYMYHWAGMQGIAYPGAMDQYPKALHYLAELRDPENLVRGDRHYVTWPEATPTQFPGLVNRARVMTLARAEGASAEWVIRCAETFDGKERSLVLLNAANLLPGDKVSVTVNGAAVADEDIRREFHPKGRSDESKGKTLPAYTSLTFAATSPPFAFLENTIGLTLLESVARASGEISVPEIEVAIATGDRSAQEVMAAMDERFPEPVKSLAGYHPANAIAYRDMRADGTTGHIGTVWNVDGKLYPVKGAQSFVLESKATITRVQLCISNAPAVEEALRLSIRADDKGVPADTPAGPQAVAVFNPWENAEGLTKQLQGYYTFTLGEAIDLDAGTWWLVFEMDPSRQPSGRSYYAPLLAASAAERYPNGRYMTGAKTWKQIRKDDKPVCAFFSVHGEYRDE